MRVRRAIAKCDPDERSVRGGEVGGGWCSAILCALVLFEVDQGCCFTNPPPSFVPQEYSPRKRGEITQNWRPRCEVLRLYRRLKQWRRACSLQLAACSLQLVACGLWLVAGAMSHVATYFSNKESRRLLATATPMPPMIAKNKA